MAQIVLGMGTSHSPQLNTPPEIWPDHAERDRRNPELFVPPHGTAVPFDELVKQRGAAVAAEITPQKWQERYDACQRGIEHLSRTLASVAPDVLIMVGDDQEELFHDDLMPAVLVYWGDTILNTPPRYANPESPAGLKAAAWAYGMEVKTYPVASDLGLHLIRSLIEDGFEVAHSRRMQEGHGMGHAFAFIYGRLMDERVMPTVPIMLNTYYPPNQPTPARCYALGQAIRRAVEAWPGNARVGIVGSGGLSHFVIDEELDQEVLRAMQGKDEGAIAALPRQRLNSGTSEIRNWIVVAGAAERLTMNVIDYVPCYRSPAGTGCAMGFAEWR